MNEQTSYNSLLTCLEEKVKQKSSMFCFNMKDKTASWKIKWSNSLSKCSFNLCESSLKTSKKVASIMINFTKLILLLNVTSNQYLLKIIYKYLINAPGIRF